MIALAVGGAALLAAVLAVCYTAWWAPMAGAGDPQGAHDQSGSPGQFWNKSDNASTAPGSGNATRQARLDGRSFYIGDRVLMPNGLELQVTQVQRDWQPPAAAQAEYGNHPSGDNPAGRETILVWFTATNKGSSPLGYTDALFTLQHHGKPEQRVAELATLPFDAYGGHGLSPWLFPGQATTTFVPFLVTPGEAPMSFQYYDVPEPSAQNPSPAMSRLTVLLTAPQGRTAQSFTFTPASTTTTGG
jgi:hypothetical protein